MTIFLAGGTPATTPGDAYDLFVQMAQGMGQRIAVAIPGSHAEAVHEIPTYAEPILRRWPSAQVEPLWLVGPDDTAWPDDPRGLAGLVLGDGDVSECLDSLAPHRDQLIRLVLRGAPLLCFGAGAMAVSRHSVAGGATHLGRRVACAASAQGLDELTMRDGLGLIGVTVETHADTALVLQRAIAALEICDATSAVALDEGICLSVDEVNGRTHTYGSGVLTWIWRYADQTQLRFETVSAPATASPEL